MRNDPGGISLVQRTRVKDWGVHLLVYCIASSVYAMSLDPVPAGCWISFCLVLLLQVCSYPAMYMLNDYADFDQDRHKARGRLPRPSRLPPALLLTLAMTGSLLVFDVLTIIVYLLALAAGLAYSFAPFRLKERGFAGILTAAFAQRLPFFVMLYFQCPQNVLSAGFVAFSLAATGMLFILYHQVEDLEVDRIAGTRTWAVRAGRLSVSRTIGVTSAGLLGATAFLWLLASIAELSPVLPVRFAESFTAMTLLTLVLFNHRYKRAMRLCIPETVDIAKRVRKVDPLRVEIIGGGLAGMMTAIKLAQWGVEVNVHAMSPRCGGSGADIEPVHFTHIDPEIISGHCGFPIGGALVRIEREEGYWGERRYLCRSGSGWAYRRGPADGTLDQIFSEVMVRQGVSVSCCSRDEPLAAARGRVLVLATGLAPAVYTRLGIPCRHLRGYQAEISGTRGTMARHFRHPLLGEDFGYCASIGDRGYALLFSRGTFPEDACNRFAGFLKTTCSIEVQRWAPLEGAVPCSPNLFHNGMILAGMVSGMFDPFYLSGIGAAVMSGRIAAMAVVQPDRAADEFEWTTRNWRIASGLSGFAQRNSGSFSACVGSAVIHGMLTQVGEPA